ncbi:MAG: hypothetical protein Q7S16_04590 [bacterium]|nr:hypothetical protein [bacterium]
MSKKNSGKKNKGKDGKLPPPPWKLPPPNGGKAKQPRGAFSRRGNLRGG